MGRLTTTSFSILGLLAMRPYAAYELTKEVRASLGFCFPRTEARLYEEPKNLVAQGLASASTETKNGRERTVYSITAAGREELELWLGQPSNPIAYESEEMVRLLFADLGDREALVKTLREMEEHALQALRESWEQAPRYVASVGPTAERLHNIALAMRFQSGMYQYIADWARAARTAVEARPADWPPSEVARILAELATGLPPYE